MRTLLAMVMFLALVCATAPASVYPDSPFYADLTVNNTGQATALSDFPVLVKLTPARVASYQGFKADGSDLRFSAGGVPLSYEIESFNPAGDSYVWVKVPNAPAAGTTTLRAHWGDSSATSQSNGPAVFSNGYAGVYHLNGTSGNALDSTVNGNNATPNGTINRNVAGQINGAAQTNATGNFNAPSSASLAIGNAGTLEGWGSLPVWNVGTEVPIISDQIHFSTADSLYLSVHNAVGLHFRYGGQSQSGNTYVTYGTSDTWADDSWHFVGGTWDRVGATTQLRLYADNTVVSGSTGLLLSTPSSTWGLGQPFATQGNFAGTLDELRISNVARTTDWMKATQLSGTDGMIGYGSVGNDTPLTLIETGGSLVQNNVAAQSRGGTAFAQNVISGYASHTIPHLNDEIYGNSNSWIGTSDPSFAGVAFDQAYSIDGIAFGRDNGGEAQQYTDRYQGIYTLQYTTVLNPTALTPDSAWTEISKLLYTSTLPDATGYLRHLWKFDVIHGATGVRILTDTAPGQSIIAIDELEVSAIPEPATAVVWMALLGLAAATAMRRRKRTVGRIS